MAEGYSELRNERVSAANGIDYAYRDTGGSQDTVPLVLFQHFRGNLDNWDPALIDSLATVRRVVTFDNAGVGGSTGSTPDTIEQMARDAIAFLAAMGFSQADLLGFSIGSFVAQQIALVRPAMVRRLILASSAPQGAAGMHGWGRPGEDLPPTRPTGSCSSTTPSSPPMSRHFSPAPARSPPQGVPAAALHAPCWLPVLGREPLITPYHWPGDRPANRIPVGSTPVVR
jgi:pimeloyl-ACP methyl ester carboxylesterase